VINNSGYSPNAARVLKSGRTRWVGDAVCTGQMRYVYKVLPIKT
jgi:hypothetical protein